MNDLNINNTTNISKNINTNDFNELNSVNISYNVNNIDKIIDVNKRQKNDKLNIKKIFKPKAKRRRTYKSEESEGNK